MAAMNQEELILAILAAAGGGTFQPVQIQKAAFLAGRNLPTNSVAEAFDFVPYDYGPFDASVYHKAEQLSDKGLAVVGTSGGRWKTYAATPKGVAEGERILASLPEKERNYVREVARWVRSLDFGSLVKSIYTAYPEMRANSIFRG